MKRFVTAIGMATLALGASAPAFAQHVSPPSTNLTAVGGATLNGLPCTLTLNATTNASGTGGTITSGTNTGPSICPLITVDSGSFTIDSYDPAGNGSADATLTGLVVSVNMVPQCEQTTPLEFTIENDGMGGSVISLAGTVDGCSVTADLATPDVTVTS